MNRRIPAMLLAVLIGTTGRLAADDKVSQWIVVTAPAFQDALAPLCDRRRADGMSVHVVRTTDVLSAAQIRDGDGELLKDHVHQLCRKSKGPSYVLLVGSVQVEDPATAEKTVVPTLLGTVGRMNGEPSDNGYGCLGKIAMPTVAVGRFPARTQEEVRLMVQKTLDFQRSRSPGRWRNRLTLLVGNPGGNSAVERRFSEWFIQRVAGTRFDQLHCLWTGRAVIHAPGSHFCVPDSRLRDVSLRYLQEGQLFSFYLGHSGASGFWSDGTRMLTREDWGKLKIPQGRGVFFTCGCFGCQTIGDDGEGYGLVAMRNPDGPVAVVGAHGESYAAMGQLALDGMMQCLSTPNPPQLLADYWLAAKSGLARGKIDPFTFWLYDQADGSRGTVSPGKQRLEHLQMWMLLGDPAMRLPVLPSTIRLATKGAAAAGESISVSGSVPASFAETRVRVTLERPMGSAVVGIRPLSNDAAKASAAMMANHHAANSVVLQACEVLPRDGRFECTLKLPAELPWPRVTVRAFVAAQSEAALGVVSLPISQLEAEDDAE